MGSMQWLSVPRQRVRQGLGSLAALLLMMTALVLAAPEAQALAGGPDCVRGELVDNQCRVEVGPPTTGEPACPVSATVLQDGDDCYRLVSLVEQCAVVSVADGNSCRQPVDLVPGSLECADGFALIDGGCYRTEDAVIDETCAEGTLEADVCVIEGAPPIAGPPTCPVSATVIQDGDECYELVAAIPGNCPDGTTDDPGGACRQPVDLVPGALRCADGFGIIDGECVRFEEGELVVSCEIGELVVELCILEGPEPEQGPPACPVSATVFEDVDGCYTIVSPAVVPDACVAPYVLFEDGRCRADNTGDDAISLVEFTCPDAPGPIEEVLAFLGDIQYIESCYYEPTTTSACPPDTTPISETECRLTVDLVPGPLTCPAEYELLSGRCLIVTVPTEVVTCVTGTPSGEICVIIGDPPVPGPASCPVSDTVIQDGAECYTIVGRQDTCPAEATLDAATGQCRQPVELVPGALECDDGFGLDADGVRCVQLADPVSTPTCVEGQLTGDLLQCIIEGDPPVAGPDVCPVSGTVIQDGDECYTLIALETVCPAGTTVDEATELCREPVELEPGPSSCADGEVLIEDVCVIFEDPVYLCGGFVVTINMVLGDDGRGTNGDDVVLGTSGADVIRTRGGNDIICAGGGDDDVAAGSGNDIVYGGGGDDRIRGNSGFDLLQGGGGNDDLRGDAGSDVVFGGSGDDRLGGGGGGDVLRGGAGDDNVNGGAGADQLYGGPGTDSCRGGGGPDIAGRTCEFVRSAF